MASALAWPATQAAACCRAAAAAATAFAAARAARRSARPARTAPPWPRPASRTAATSPATIITSQRGRPGRDRRVQLSRRRSHSRTVVTSTVPQDGSAAGRCPDGGGSAWPGCGSPASGWPGSGDGWGGRAGSGPSCHQSGRKSSGGRGLTYGAGRPGSPGGPGGVACPGGPSPGRRRFPGKPGRHRRPRRVSVPPGQLGRYGRGRAGRLGRPGPVRRKLAGARREDYLDVVGGRAVVTGTGRLWRVFAGRPLSCGCARTAPPPAVSPGGGGRPLRDCMLVSPGPHGARSCA